MLSCLAFNVGAGNRTQGLPLVNCEKLFFFFFFPNQRWLSTKNQYWVSLPHLVKRLFMQRPCCISRIQQRVGRLTPLGFQLSQSRVDCKVPTQTRRSSHAPLVQLGSWRNLSAKRNCPARLPLSCSYVSLSNIKNILFQQ